MRPRLLPMPMPMLVLILVLLCCAVPPALASLSAEDQRALLEDAVQSILELRVGDEGFLGSQLPFSVWVLVAQGVWPKEFELWFKTWKKKPRDMVKELGAVFANADEQERSLAQMCLNVELSPSVAPPSKEALTVMAQRSAELTNTGTIPQK